MTALCPSFRAFNSVRIRAVPPASAYHTIAEALNATLACVARLFTDHLCFQFNYCFLNF